MTIIARLHHRLYYLLFKLTKFVTDCTVRKEYYVSTEVMHIFFPKMLTKALRTYSISHANGSAFFLFQGLATFIVFGALVFLTSLGALDIFGALVADGALDAFTSLGAELILDIFAFVFFNSLFETVS